MVQKNTYPFDVIVDEDCGIVMPDGVRLSARLWRPVTDDPVPLILEFLPYRKRDGTIARDEMMHPYLAGHGYACLRVDMRGNGDSEGLLFDEYTPQELQDACDTIAWARAQDWCTGRVGMQGISWGGFNCLQVAALQPEGLDAVISICSTVDRYADDIHYKGGCLLGENFGWASQMFAYSSRPPDPALAGERWREMWLERLEAQPFLLSTWLRHQHRDAYWAHGSICEDYAAVRARVLSVGGWADGYRNTISHIVSNIPGSKGIVGPWNHKYPFYAGPEPRIGFLQEMLRWYDRWLKDAETGVEDDPDMRLWLMDAVRPKAWHEARPGRWIAEPTWPAARIAAELHHLGPDGLQAQPGAVSAAIASPPECGAVGGEYFPFAFGAELPVDQRPDDALSACFDGVPLDAPRDIVGAPEVTLRLVPEAATGQVAVRLCDVFPDGTSAFVTHGVFNLTHHASHAAPTALTPGAEIEVRFALDQIAYRVPAGHRLRLAVSTACWPLIWPSPHDRGVTLTGGSLALPVRPEATASEWRFEPPAHATGWDAEPLRPARYRRQRIRDYGAEESVLLIENDNGANRDRAHGLESGSKTVERWVNGPSALSARAEIAWEETLRRGDWSVRTETETAMWADAESFRFTATLRAYEGEALVFEKVLEDAVPRALV